MSEPTLKPFTGKLDDNTDTNQQPALKPFTGALDGEKKGVMGHLKDTGLSALKGAIAVPELAVGIMDVMSDGATGKTLENKDGTVGFRPKEAKQALGDLHTDQYKAQQQEFADAGKDGNWVDKVVDKTKVALTNPSLIANTVVESVPSMLAGGVLGRASGIANPVVAGAVGEGAVMAGSQAEQIRQQTVDGRLTADQSLAGVGTGALGGLIGFAGGRLAQKMGIGDVDTMLVTGRAGPAEIAGEIASMPAKSLPRRVIEGAISEGFLEELPQSVSEQVIQNLALDKPWHDGIEDAAVMGTLAGMAMGGAANILSGRNTGTESQDNQQQSGSPNLPSAPPQLGSSPDNALTGEYIPREDVSQGGNQGRTAFVYDQPSMDADNLLNNNGFDYGSAATGNPVSPDTPPAPNGNYFDGDYGSEAAFDDLLNSVPPASQTPSQQMGINPNDGPMSSAAALAVDSGASPVSQLGYTPEQQTQEQSNTPISDVVPNDYRQLLGNHNEGQSFNTNFEDAAIQQGNAQSDNAGESISQQYDINTADEMAGEFEKNGTESAPQTKTTQPILGQDGKNKWFGSQEKAKAFLDKKNLGNDYQVVQDGKRFEIQPKSQVAQNQNDNLNNQNSILNTKNTISNTENNIDKIQKISALEQQLANEKSVIKKVRLRKQITELQNGLDQNQVSASLDEPRKATAENLSGEFKRMEQATARVNAVRQRMREANPEIFTAENDRVRETHGLTNARVTSIADEIETSGNYELSDREYEKIKNNPNYKIDYDARNFMGKVTAVKDPHSGEWVGNNEQSDLDNAAHEAATSVHNDLPEPTQAQIEAGNYKKGHIKVHGLDIAVENPRGSERRGTDPDGNEWSHNMSDHYGYIKRTTGADQEHIDTYVGKNPESENVFIVDQIDQGSGGFDEHKVMLGFDSQEEAITAYKSNFDKGWKVGPVTQMSKDQFKDWLKNSDTSKPVAESGQKTEPQHPVNKWQEEMNKALAKADPEHPSFKKLQANAKHGLKSVSDRASALRQAREIEKKLEAPKAEPKNPKASTNTIFTEDAAEKARALLRKKLGQLNAGIDPEILQAGITLAGYHIEKGARSFAAYAKAMTEDMGDLVKPYLKSWYMGVKFDPRAADFDGMSTSAEVENFDLNGDNNEQSASSNANTQGTSAVRGGRGRTSQSNAPQANNPNVETGVSTGSGTSNQNQSTGRSRIRDTGTDVENDGRVSGRGMESSRRKDASGTGQLSVDQPTRLESPAAVANTATDFYMADPDIIFGGSQKQRFDKNKKALELLEELNAEGRQATAEEQVVLASYTGWGSFGQDLFQGTWNTPVFKDGWKDENLWLREKLGKESWESAKDSVLNAFFTDPYTVQAMWSMAEKMGFTGGRVLEPAVGTGNFISLMPMHIKQRSQVTAIDLDITTAAIAKQLFPESNVQNMPYQKSKTPDNFYDLVISNVPFSNDVKIADRRYNQFNPNLHDYYFLKMLDQVRPGGIVMAITSSGTMDKQSEVIRRELAKRAELVTSVRLPSGAFKEFAGTAVVTDIIVLRKRAEPLAMTPDEKWIKPAIIITPSGKPVTINSFFALNPQNILGTLDYKGGDPRFAGMTVHSPGESALKKQLEQLADLVSENTLLPRHNDDYLTYYANKAGERTNTLTMSNGELMFVYGDQMVKATDLFEYKIKDAKKTAQRQKSIEDLVAIRKAYIDLTDAERIEQDNVEQLRKTLNKLYQAYTKEHGPLADSFGLQYFRKLSDAYYYSLAALEVNGKPAEILKRSVVRGAAALDNPTVSDAFVVERNKSAAPSLANIAKMAQVSEDQARAELLEKGAVYVLPNGDIMPSDMYLSGNVRQKLEEAQNAVAEGNTDLQRNVDALKEIIPEDIPYFNIEAKMGATWVPLSDYEKYIAHMLGMNDSNGITVTFPSGKWKVKLDPIAARRTEATTNYGSKYKSFQTVVSAALSNQNITVKYKNADGSESVDVQATEEVNEKISKIKEDFSTWLWSDPERRVQLEKEYNHTFNAWATPKYDGSFMSMQGMALSLGNGPFNLRQHQQNAIWRAIVNRRSINAHEVGTGKTFTMGGIALESRRYGIAKKPLILAHNANSAAVAKEIQMMYPSARVLFISELGKAVRQIRMRQIANDDWDVVVMPHSMIDKLTLSEETLMAMAADDIAALEAELEEALAEEGGATLDEVLAMDSETVNKKMGFKNPTAKQLAKQRLKLLEDIQKQAMDSSKADAVNFEELGVDMIMVDEVHEFKKPSIATRMNMKGLNTSSNKRSVNLQLLTRYVRRMNNGGNVHTFTGTPITNTLTEIYHQMRYVMEEEMQKLNVAAWDGWFGSFATDITDIELSATGEYQLVTRLAGFVNVPELRKMIGQFMDIVFANDMPEMQPRKTKTGKVLSDEGLTEAEKAELLNDRTEGAKDRPYKKVINVTTEMSPKQEQTLAEIQSLAKEWERASGKQKRQWMRDGDPRAPLSISTAAKKASYDARIGDPEYVGKEGQTEDFEMSKASQVVKNVMEVYHSHPLASQVIFADTGYNTTTERSTGQKDDKGKTIRERVKVFSPIKDIVERLVQSGIPREQIAIVDGSVKAEARKAIADKVNTGEIRVVIGLTQTLGVGVNMQRNLRAMHHLDAPWMPGELEQRNGRGLRQGNQWNTVLEYRYITDKLDGKSWQVLAIKDRFINAFMKADGNVRSIEGDAAADNGEDNAGDIMSSFSEASGDPRVLQRIKMKEKLEKLQRKERLHTQGIADMKRTIGNTQRRIARFDEQIAEYENNAVLDRIQKLMQSQSENFSAEVDGKKYDKHKEASDAIQQFIADHVRTGSSRITLGKYGNVTMSVEWDSLQPQATLSMKIGPIEFRGNTLRGIEGKLRGVSQDIQAIEDAKASAQQTIDSLSKAAEQPFGQADQLARTQKQLENIEQDLEINPVAPPIWLRRGAPIDSEVYYKGKLFIVSGHRYTNDGWFVSADDAKGTIEIPYLEATDNVGMPIYEEREFEAPNINDKTKADNDVKNEINDYSRDKLKPDNERRGISPLDTTFNALSVVSATRRVLSVLQHLKLSATQDSSISGRITVGSAGIKGGFDVQVISSFDGLPTEIQKDATYQDDKGNTQNYDVSAVWHKGTLYVVADQVYGDTEKQITTFDAYEEMLAHEIIGHFGVQQIFGQEYKTKLQQLYNALGELEGIRKIASKNGVNMAQFESAYIEPYTQGAKEGIYAESDVQQALVGELFAFVAQNAKSRPFVRQKLKEVIGYIRQWFRDRGFDKFLSRYNDADLMMFLSEARKAVVDRSYFGKYKNQEFSSKNNSDTPLYSRRTKSNSGSTTQQVRDVLIDRFGKETIDELERQGKLEIIQDYQVEGVEGFYYSGKAVLVASNLTAESTVPTFLHELGGHAGFQNMMNQKQYNELMNQFNKLVDQGNPVAMAAKLLAEREQGSERQHLEYLPYLLTLSSTMQQRNVIQRNALQKLINNLVTYVKATLFDNFGINLNLNPNDIVALAERMIEKSSYNAENATSPLYSRQSMQDTIDKLSQNLKSLTIKSIKDKSGDKKIDWLGVGLSALGRRQLTEIYSKILPQLNKYNELAAQMDADKNDAGAEADSIVREWANLNDEDQLAELMHDSTLAKIDPTKPYVSGDSISKYKQLRDAYNSLSPEAQAMYLKARDAYKKHYAEVHQAIKERILRSELSNQKKADLLKQMDDNFFGSIKGVYFPLARFGKYVVVMRNQNGEVESVSRAETMGEAQALRSELIQKFPHYKVNKVKLDKEYNKSRDAVGRGFMTSLFAEVDNLGLSTAERTEFEDTLSQLYLSSMPDLSWAKHGIHRKGTAGFSQDARRAFAQNMFSGANYLAKLRYGDQLAQQLDEMQKYADEQFEVDEDYDQRSAQSVITEMNKRHDNLMNPKGHPLSSALTSLGFIYYLGLSPAAAMVNLSQTALVAYPLMGAKWDFDKAGKELLKASNDFRKGLEFHKVKWQGTKTDLYKAVSSDISKFLNKDEQAAYQKAVDSGVIDVTQAHDLAGIAQGEDSGVMWKTRPIMRAASVMFHSAERFNREVTFIASYRLARQAGANHDDAYEQADKMTYDSHYDYGSGNRPRIMQGNVAKVLLLFKQFGQNMVYTLARQTYQSIKGETKEERREARRAISAILAMHAIFAGALGLPMVGMLLSVASWMGGDDDDPWDAEVALRNYLAEAFGPTISNMLMKGAPRGIGVDISGRVGINNLLLPDVQEGLEGKKWWDSASAAVLGPIGGIGANIAKGAQEISEGHNLRGVESMLPVFLKNFAKTYRYADEGVQDKTGVSIMDEVSSMDLLVQGMGFSPSDVRTASEGKTAIYQLNRKLNERRSRLMALWSRAKMMDDQQEMDEIWEEIQGFNDKNPSRRITRMNLNQSYRNRQRRIDRAEDGIYLSRNRQDAREAGYFAFGE